MGFSGKQIGELVEIIKSSFTAETLEQFLDIRLEKNLYDYTEPASFPFMIFNLLKGVSMEGWELELLAGLKNERPKNKRLLMFAFEADEVDDITISNEAGELRDIISKTKHATLK